MGKKYLYGEMTWPEIAGAAEENRVALLPVGTIEDHGPHLPVDADTRITWEICRRAGKLIPEEVVVIPPVIHGYSPHHMDFPGALTIGAETFSNYILDICNSLIHHRFKRILIANGHGSNSHLLECASRLVITGNQGKALCHSVSVTGSVLYSDTAKRILEESPDRGGHADEAETSIYLALNPDSVDMTMAARELRSRNLSLKSVSRTAPMMVPYWSTHTRSGIMGDATLASIEKGEKLLDAAVRGLAEIVREFRAMEMGERVDHHNPG